MISMTLEFDVAVKALDEHVEILKQELLFAMAVWLRKTNRKALQEFKKLSQSKENWIKPCRRE